MAKVISKGIENKKLNISTGSHSSDEDTQSMIEHIKSTLLMYLKKQPIIDEANESILSILFSMMKVTKNDKEDVVRAR